MLNLEYIHDALKKEARMDEPALLPAKKGSRKPQPNFEYLYEKHSGFGVSAASRMYEEYVSACERAGMPPCAWTFFKKISREYAKIKAQQQLNPGEFLYCAGRRLPKNQEYDESGKRRNLFVAISLYSEYSFACVCENAKSSVFPNELWMRCSTNAFRHFGGVHRATLCPNLRRSLQANKVLTWSYTLHAFASHYKTVCFYPCCEKDRREHFVNTLDLGISRFINSRIKGCHCLSTEELGRLVSQLSDEFNGGVNLHGIVRREDFIARELPNLLPLPAEDYDMPQWCERTVGRDYHFKYKHVYYSVPYQYAGETVLVRVSDDVIEAYSGGKLIASHRLRTEDQGRRVITDPSHRPEPHKAIANRLTKHFMKRARQIGPSVAAVMKELCSACKTSGGSYRICKELLDLQGKPSELSLEEACREVLRGNVDATVQSVSCVMGHLENRA